MLDGAVPPHQRTTLVFNYVPPVQDAGSVSILVPIGRRPLERPQDTISDSVLGFNKAAALDVSYEESLANVGLD